MVTKPHFENISLGITQNDVGRGKEYVLERVIKAAKLAEAHEFIIDKCESGYDMVPHTANLSSERRAASKDCDRPCVNIPCSNTDL
mmetsp:Transcript_15468/g.23380  ORF Transcript_15468/g.23380 Transcript_15468/m.23380 type:complete len:86 (-) Transcript_15468:299-556(-)